MVSGGVTCDDCTKRCKELHDNLNESSPVISRFFKVMFGDDYKKVLYLPPEFARTVQHLAYQETQIEDRNGKQWPVTLSKVKGCLAFHKGWHKFFLDHGLKQGQLVTFKYIEGSHFFVHIYGKSAVERINFHNEMPRPNKRPRRGEVTASEDEPVQTADVNSGDKPTPVASVAVRSEFQNLQTDSAVKDADSGRVHPLPVYTNMEDPVCMINRNDGNYLGDDSNLLHDLSIFEMQNITSNPSKFRKVTSTKLDSSGDDAKLTKTTGDDAQTGVVHKSEIKGHSGDKSETIKIMNQMKGCSCGILNIKSEKVLETKTVSSHTEIAKQTIEKGDTQTAVTHSSQTAGHFRGIGTGQLFKKPYEKRSLSKGILDDVSNAQNCRRTCNNVSQSSGESPTGSRQIAEGVHLVKRRLHESPVSSSVLKDPFGKHAIKRERVEMEDEVNGLPQVYCGNAGKEPAMVGNHGQMFSAEVKVESDESYDTGPMVAISPFSVEVKSKSYLELPTEFPLLGRRFRRDIGRGRVLYLRDSIGRILPVLHPDISALKALTVNWTRFCENNNIKPGDKCRFSQIEDGSNCDFEVNVDRRSGESPRKNCCLATLML